MVRLERILLGSESTSGASDSAGEACEPGRLANISVGKRVKTLARGDTG